VHAQRFLRVGGDLPGHLVGQAGIDPPMPEHGGQFLPLGLGMDLQLVPLLADLGLDQLVLR
jgi:hypothetical protein